ncbi:MAG: hypothetical protein R6U53_07110 [Natronomonas sp.]
MEVRRTVPVKLDVDSDDAAPLRETVDEFLWAATYVVGHAWQGEYAGKPDFSNPPVVYDKRCATF